MQFCFKSLQNLSLFDSAKMPNDPLFTQKAHGFLVTTYFTHVRGICSPYKAIGPLMGGSVPLTGPSVPTKFSITLL